MSRNIVAEPLGISVLSDALRAWRKANHYTQERAAEVLDVSPNTYTTWEHVGIIPRYDRLEQIASAIGLDARTLLEAR